LNAPFRDGVAAVLLAATPTVSDATLAIATALGLPAQSARPMLDRLVDALRDRALLLVLDNLEQLLDLRMALAWRRCSDG
ncbi:MAG TPA: hypothetical protein VFU22_30345, partial [Roseiflexaceae bacterium]|nr:hypothetical protein [Roseiflexaceae bacterium]